MLIGHVFKSDYKFVLIKISNIAEIELKCPFKNRIERDFHLNKFMSKEIV